MNIIVWLEFELGYYDVVVQNVSHYAMGTPSDGVLHIIHGAFNKFPDFFVQAFKVVIDSWKFSMLLLYILGDDWPIFMISGLNE